MRINVAIPESHVSAPVLNSALEATTKLNEQLIRSGELEPFSMRSPGVRWRPEPPGEEHFDHGLIVQGRGHGDCDDLAPWHAASLRVTGRDPGARAFVKPSGPQRWHALVRRSDGSVDDPSLAAGMPAPGQRHGVRGGVQPMMLVVGSASVGSAVGSYILRPQLAMRPVLDRLSREVEAWQTRTDLPWHASPGRSPADVAMVSLHASPVPDQALVGSLEGMIALGAASGAPPEQLDRLRCLSDMLQGASWEECAACYGPAYADASGAIVGAFFKKLGRKLKKGFKGLARTALKLAPAAAAFIPGVGPVVAPALAMASPALQRLVAKDKHKRPQERAPQYAMPMPEPQYAMPSPEYAMPYAAPYAAQYAPQYAPQYTPQYYAPQDASSVPYGMQWGG